MVAPHCPTHLLPSEGCRFRQHARRNGPQLPGEAAKTFQVLEDPQLEVGQQALRDAERGSPSRERTRPSERRTRAPGGVSMH